jgi:hypothetical protein
MRHRFLLVATASLALAALAGWPYLSARSSGRRPASNDAAPYPVRDADLPPMDQPDASQYYGFDVRTRTVSDVFEDIRHAGFPAGLDGLDTVPDYNRLRVRGTPEAVQAVRRMVAAFDTGAKAGRVVHQIRLQHIYATPDDLALSGLTLEDFRSGLNEMTGPAITGKVRDAVARGLLRVAREESVTARDGETVTRSHRRAIRFHDPAFWPSRRIPLGLDTWMTFAPTLTQPGRVEFTVEQGVREIGSRVLPTGPMSGEHSERGRHAWSRDGETIVLGRLMEEEHVSRTAGGGFQTEGLMHLVLATTNTQNPGSAPAPLDPMTSDRLAAVVCMMVAPADAWRSIGLDPDDQTPRMAPGHLGYLRGAPNARDTGPALDATIFPGRVTPLMSARLAPGPGSMYTVLRFRARRVTPDTAEVWVDLEDSPAPGAAAPEPIQAHYQGMVADGGPPTLFLSSRAEPGGKDLRRLTFVVFTLHL